MVEVGDPAAGLGELQGTEAEKTALVVVRDVGDLFTFFYLDPGPIAPDWWGDSMSGQEQLASITAALAKLISSEEPTAAPDLMWEKTLAEAADLHDFAEDVNVIPFEVKSGEKKGHAFLIAVQTESAEQPGEEGEDASGEAPAEESAEEAAEEGSETEPTEATAPEPEPESESEPEEETPSQAAPAEKNAPAATRSSPEYAPEVGIAPHSAKSFEQLPLYARTLLHVKVPVVVTLATKRESVSEILSLSPGSILQFEKSCEEPLDLSVVNRPIARGEAVKVGERFGLRIMSMLLPKDRHITLKPKSEPVSV